MAMADSSLDPLDMDVVMDARRMYAGLGYELYCWSWKWLSTVGVSGPFTGAGGIASATIVNTSVRYV